MYSCTATICRIMIIQLPSIWCKLFSMFRRNGIYGSISLMPHTHTHTHSFSLLIISSCLSNYWDAYRNRNRNIRNQMRLYSIAEMANGKMKLTVWWYVTLQIVDIIPSMLPFKSNSIQITFAISLTTGSCPFVSPPPLSLPLPLPHSMLFCHCTMPSYIRERSPITLYSQGYRKTVIIGDGNMKTVSVRVYINVCVCVFAT